MSASPASPIAGSTSTEALAKTLQAGDPTPLFYDTEGTPEDVLKEDKQIERFPRGQAVGVEAGQLFYGRMRLRFAGFGIALRKKIGLQRIDRRPLLELA